MEIVNENSVYYINLVNLDNGSLSAPSYLRWNLKNLSNNTQVVQWTEVVSGLASSMTIQIDATHNQIITQTNPYERMLCTVYKYFDDSKDAQYEEFEYLIKNLSEV